MGNILFRRGLDFVWSASDLDRLWPIGLVMLRFYFGAAVLIAHGWPKLQEMVAGQGPFLELVKSLGFPAPVFFAWFAVAGQVVGSLLVVFGLWTRPAALVAASTIAFGVLAVHWSAGFKSMEVGLAYSVVLLAIAVTGPGRLSLDRAIRSRE